jgi:hypothetical protein
MRYYWKNVDKIKTRNLERYYENKGRDINTEKNIL